MKTEEKAKKVQNIATALAAIFGAVGAFFGIFQAQMSANLKNQVTSLQNVSQQTIVNVISTLGDTLRLLIWHSLVIRSQSPSS